MARKARVLAGSGYYHVVNRGIGQQILFEDDQDYRRFLKYVKKFSDEEGFEVHAYCLMENHVHLLLHGEARLDRLMKRVGVTYAHYYNEKYDRTGHLFQDRFRSEAVESDAYFFTVLRYIMQNPVKAGLVNHPGAWRWSSFLAYEKGTGTITDTGYAAELFGGREELVAYLTAPNEDAVMDEESFDRELREDLAREKMIRISGCASVAEFQRLDRKTQKAYAGMLLQEGISANQISRMTGMSRTTVYRMAREAENPEAEKAILSEPEEALYDAEGIIW